MALEALDAEKVRVATTGAVYVGPPTAPAPMSATSAIPVAYANTGFVNEDGVTEAYEEDTEDIRAWQGGQIVRRVISESSATLQFMMIETRRASLELYHKGSKIVPNVSPDGDAAGFRLDVRPPERDPRRFIIDMIDGSFLERIFVPLGEVTERGEITYVNDNVIGYQVTITCSPVTGEDGRPLVMTKFSNDPAWGEAASDIAA